jgi:hypothetical protein
MSHDSNGKLQVPQRKSATPAAVDINEAWKREKQEKELSGDTALIEEIKSICTDTLEKLDACPESAGVHLANAITFLKEARRKPDDADGDLSGRLAARIYSPQSKPVEPMARYFIGNTPICTPGNLTTISAQAKAGKSAAIGAMIASTFATPEADCLGFNSQNPDGLAVVHLDTEQSTFDHWQGIQRAIRRAKIASAPPWLRSHCLTGFSAADVRASIRVLLEQSAEKFGGVHSVLIDGIADAASDVNNAEETSGLITELHKVAIEFDCPILTIIHLNPGSDFKTRGHLGSQLERKSETNLRLKNEDGISVLWADKNRRAPIPEESGPCFAWSDSERMHVTVQNPAEAKAEARIDAKRTAMRQDAEAAFSRGEKPALKHKQLVELLCVAFDLKPAGARRRIENWVNSLIVSKDDSGLYTLTQ